jgi:Fic family protein
MSAWQLAAIWSQARSATVAASTAIEGNPLTDAQVDAVLGGGQVDADQVVVREILNYSDAMNVAARAAERGATWSEDLVQEVNATITRGLPVDTGGRYRVEGVRVGIYAAPHELMVPALMRELVDWLRRSPNEPALPRSALVHLNVIGIHPFEDGNGRTARVLSSFELMRSGIRVPELITIETYLRANRDEYVDALRTVLGMSYDPDNHPATSWVEYYARISVDRLEARNRLLEAMPNDFGMLMLALDGAGEPVTWLPILLAAALAPVRTSEIAHALGAAPVTLRANLQRMSAAGWVEPVGRTKARRYRAGPRLLALELRVPAIWRWMRSGQREPRSELDDPA